MRIGIDMDDTITDSYSVIIPKMEEYYGLSKNKLYEKRYDYEILDNLPNYKEFLNQNKFDMLLSNVPIRYRAKEVINSLYDQGCEIYIVTARNYVEYKDPYLATKKCLEKNGIKYTKILVDCKDKGKICREYDIDFFIDDAIKNCIDVNNTNIKSIQIKTIFRPTDCKISLINNWEDIYSCIKCLSGYVIR